MAKEKMTGWPIGGSEKKWSFRKRNAELIDVIGSENYAEFRKEIGNQIISDIAESPSKMRRMDPLSLEEYILNQVYNEKFQSKIPYDFAKDIVKDRIKRFDNKRKQFSIGGWWSYVEDCRFKCGRNYKLNENKSTNQASRFPVRIQDIVDSPLFDPEDDPADQYYKVPSADYVVPLADIHWNVMNPEDDFEDSHDYDLDDLHLTSFLYKK